MKVGEKGWPGKLVLGRGTAASKGAPPREGFALVVDVPARNPVCFVGSWRADRPAYSEQIRDMVRALAICELRPNRGCVKTAP